jgi:hypothetical protein
MLRDFTAASRHELESQAQAMAQASRLLAQLRSDADAVHARLRCEAISPAHGLHPLLGRGVSACAQCTGQGSPAHIDGGAGLFGA